MVKYIHKETKQVAVDAKYDEKFKTYTLIFEDGTQKPFSASTIKRWWKRVEEDEVSQPEEVVEQKEVVSEDVAGDGTPLAEVGKEIATQATEKSQDATEKAKKSTKTGEKKIRKQRVIDPEVENSIKYVLGIVSKSNDEIFSPASGVKVYAFKVGGHMYARLNYSLSSVTLAISSKVNPEGIKKPDKIINHMFDSLYEFKGSLTKEDKALISDLLKISRKYRVSKNTKKEEK